MWYDYYAWKAGFYSLIFATMKYFLPFIVLLTTTLNAQTILNFDKRFVQSEDKWVAFKPDKDSSYTYGFIYVDEVAGLTFNYEGTFRILKNGEFVPKKLDSAGIKVRLTPNNVLIAFIPDSKFTELKINGTPEWLKHYKTDTNSVARLYRWGYMYNGWAECAKALTYLQRAQKIDPGYKGLSVELAYSYNCLGRYDDAISVLKSALKTNPDDAYTNKELVFAQIKSGRLEDAATSCKQAIADCTDQKYNGENCYNLLHTYYERKDKKNFNLWLKETKKWNAGNEPLMKSILVMESNIGQ
jgi:tetratricopeptide (TPR) repeat protein